MSFAEVKNVNGSPALVIDGKTFPPMAMTVRFNKPDYIRHLGEAGLQVFFLMTPAMSPAAWRPSSKTRGSSCPRCPMPTSS